MDKKKIKKYIKNIFYFSFLFVFILFFWGVIFIFITLKNFPQPEKFTESIIPQSSKIYDRTGKIILYEISGDIKSTYISFDQIPQNLKNAVIAIEDKDFYQHKGIDFRDILRAILVDIKLKKFAQGGSTITQQLVRNYFLTQKKTIKRKTQEVILALQLEKKYPKDQIFEWYLNIIPFGSNLYGVESASNAYFGKNAKDLNLAECAILAAMIKSPSSLSPWFGNKEALLKRRNLILEKMAQLKYISEEEKENAKREELIFKNKTEKIFAPHFVFFIKDYLEQKYGKEFLETRGLKIITTLDVNLQKIAEKTIKERENFIKKYNAFNASLVAILPKTGEIVAMVGSKDYFGEPYPQNCISGQTCLFDPKVNIATSLNEPGSSIKPFAYALLLEKGFTPRTQIWDAKTEFNLNCSPDANQDYNKYNQKCYHPQNYDGRYRGKVNLKEALAQSLNLPAVKVLYLVGLDNFLNFLEKTGITTLTERNKYGLSLVLGGGGVKLLEEAYIYTIFPNEGEKPPLNFIIEIKDDQNNILENIQNNRIKVLSTQIAREINDILSDNIARAPIFGWNSSLYFANYDVAVKTGTTQEYKDDWAIGYNPSLLCGIWVGNNNNTPLKAAGAVVAGPILHDFFDEAFKIISPEKFVKPKIRKTGNAILDGGDLGEHSLLYYLNPSDPAFLYWETGVKNWLAGIRY